jgi:hypothetical protein
MKGKSYLWAKPVPKTSKVVPRGRGICQQLGKLDLRLAPAPSDLTLSSANYEPRTG